MSLKTHSLLQTNNHLTFIRDFIKFDLDQGPYVTGSYMTWLIEKYNNDPLWLPDDLDIVCRSPEQHEEIKNILIPLSSSIKETNWMDTGSTYWMINDFKFQSFVHPVSAEVRVECTDFTINSVASDGLTYIADEHTVDDIADKVLRFKDSIYNLWPLESTMSRYKKYSDRGYVDIDNMSLKKINQLHNI